MHPAVLPSDMEHLGDRPSLKGRRNRRYAVPKALLNVREVVVPGGSATIARQQFI
jgi:hypothetical protein